MTTWKDEDAVFYCPHCDVEVKREELIKGCCPFCDTEIPEAVGKGGSNETD